MHRGYQPELQRGLQLCQRLPALLVRALCLLRLLPRRKLQALMMLLLLLLLRLVIAMGCVQLQPRGSGVTSTRGAAARAVVMQPAHSHSLVQPQGRRAVSVLQLLWRALAPPTAGVGCVQS